MDWKERIAEKGNDGKIKALNASRKWYGWIFEAIKVGKE